MGISNYELTSSRVARNAVGVNIFDIFFFGNSMRMGDIGSFIIRHRQILSESHLDSLLKALEKSHEPQVHAV